MEFTLLWAAATGIGVALLMARWERSLGLIPDETGSLSDLILGAAVSGLITGRLAAMVLAGTSPFTHPGDILIVRGGVDTGFASLGALTFISLTFAPGLTYNDRCSGTRSNGRAGRLACRVSLPGCVFGDDLITALGRRAGGKHGHPAPGGDLCRPPLPDRRFRTAHVAAPGSFVLRSYRCSCAGHSRGHQTDYRTNAAFPRNRTGRLVCGRHRDRPRRSPGPPTPRPPGPSLKVGAHSSRETQFKS